MAWIKCNGCGHVLSSEAVAPDGVASCPACRRRLEVRLFPAVHHGGAAPPALPGEPPQPGEAACFHDPTRKATKTCGHCGVFISDAWAARWGRETVCLKCLDELRTRGRDSSFEKSRTLWDNIALGFSLGPFVLALLLTLTIIGYVFGALLLLCTLITAPAAIFVALRYWKAPRSLVPRGPARLLLALSCAVLQLLAWVVGFVLLIAQIGNF